jgi:hypothetical protein
MIALSANTAITRDKMSAIPAVKTLHLRQNGELHNDYNYRNLLL